MLAARRAQPGIQPDLPTAEPVDPAGDPLSALEYSDGVRHLNQALATLPDELRECLVLRELEELSYKEIAQVTGAPIGTVMSRLWRARRALLDARV